MALIINGETVDDALLRQEAAAMRPRYEEAMAGMDPIEAEIQLRDWSRENVIERVLLRQEAMRDSSPVTEEEIEKTVTLLQAQPGMRAACVSLGREELRKEAEARLRVDRLLERLASKIPAPKPKEVTEYYQRNKEQFWTEETIRAAHIVKNLDENSDENAAMETMQKAQQELAQGAAFAEVADRYSDCAGNGGDLGFFARGTMVPEFDEVVFALETGAMSGIFRSTFGLHIARVMERRAAGIRPFDEVKEAIENMLRGHRQEKLLEDFVDGLRAKAVIEDTRKKDARKNLVTL